MIYSLKCKAMACLFSTHQVKYGVTLLPLSPSFSQSIQGEEFALMRTTFSLMMRLLSHNCLSVVSSCPVNEYES